MMSGMFLLIFCHPRRLENYLAYARIPNNRWQYMSRQQDSMHSRIWCVGETFRILCFERHCRGHPKKWFCLENDSHWVSFAFTTTSAHTFKSTPSRLPPFPLTLTNIKAYLYRASRRLEWWPITVNNIHFVEAASINCKLRFNLDMYVATTLVVEGANNDAGTPSSPSVARAGLEIG